MESKALWVKRTQNNKKEARIAFFDYSEAIFCFFLNSWLDQNKAKIECDS